MYVRYYFQRRRHDCWVRVFECGLYCKSWDFIPQKSIRRRGNSEFHHRVALLVFFFAPIIFVLVGVTSMLKENNRFENFWFIKLSN
jgi:hypothetical protein